MDRAGSEEAGVKTNNAKTTGTEPVAEAAGKAQVKQTCRSDLDFQVKDEEVEHEDHSI